MRVEVEVEVEARLMNASPSSSLPYKLEGKLGGNSTITITKVNGKVNELMQFLGLGRKQ